MKRVMMLLPVMGLAACSSPQPTQYEQVQYQCGEQALAIAFDRQAQTAQFEQGDVWYKLLWAESSEQQGDYYRFGLTELWVKDKQATLAQQGATVLACSSQPAEAGMDHMKDMGDMNNMEHMDSADKAESAQ